MHHISNGIRELRSGSLLMIFSGMIDFLVKINLPLVVTIAALYSMEAGNLISGIVSLLPVFIPSFALRTTAYGLWMRSYSRLCLGLREGPYCSVMKTLRVGLALMFAMLGLVVALSLLVVFRRMSLLHMLLGSGLIIVLILIISSIVDMLVGIFFSWGIFELGRLVGSPVLGLASLILLGSLVVGVHFPSLEPLAYLLMTLALFHVRV